MQSVYDVIAGIPGLYDSHRNIVTSNGHTVPLWQRNENEQEYYEIEILTNETGNTELPFDKSMDEIINLNKYTCHICNIEVPKTYIKEHNRSNKHLICNEIANLALDRTKLQKQLDISGTRKVEIRDTYFCEPCAVVVFNADKTKHDGTKLHKISCKHDELLTDLLKIYTDINNVDVRSEVDELDWLQQRIELEESGLQKMDTDSFESLKEDVAAEVTEMNTFIDKMTVETAKLGTDQTTDNANNKFDDKTKDENKKAVVEVNRSRNSKNKALKKQQKKQHLTTMRENEVNISEDIDESQHQMVRKKEGLQKTHQATTMRENEVNISKEIDESPHQKVKKKEGLQKTYQTTITMRENKANISEDLDKSLNDVKRTAVVANKARPSNRTLLTGKSKKIDNILSRYFDSNCTVDALNDNAIRDYKKKTSKDTNKNRTSKDQDKNQEEGEEEIGRDLSVNDKEQNKNFEQKEYVESEQTNFKMEENIMNDQINLIEPNEENTEQNNNRISEENNNRISERNHNKTTKLNKKKKTENNEDIKETNKASKPKHPQAPNFSLVYYLKDITRRCQTDPIHTVVAITDNIVQITAINGDKFKVCLNSFHGFHVKSNNIYCKLCESPNVRRPEWHIIESEHRAKVMIPIKDLNGIRQVDDIWSHCILCNDLTNNTVFHLRSLLHKNKLKNSLIELGYTSVTDNDRTNQKTRLKRKINDYDPNSLICKSHLTETGKGYLNCIMCEVIVNSDSRSIEQHITSLDHLNNYDKEQSSNKVIDVGRNFYCIGCDVNFIKHGFWTHCNGRKHKKNLGELLKRQGENFEEEVDSTEVALPSISQNVKKQYRGKMDSSELICFVCNIIIYWVKDHADSFEHNKNYFTYLESNKLNEMESGMYHCVPCNTVISINYLMSHCTSHKHRTVLKKFIDSKGALDNEQECKKETTQFPSTSQMLSQWNKKSIPCKVLYQFREVSNATKLQCTMCNEEIPYNRKHASDHVNTLDHVVAFNLTMLWNKIKKCHDNYFCDICRININYFCEIRHVFGKQHAGNLAKEPKGTVYEYDRTLLTHAYVMSLSVGKRTRHRPVITVTKLHKN